jgi:hypothetical protein
MVHVSAPSRRTSHQILEYKYGRSGQWFNKYWNGDYLKSANIHSIQYWNPGIIGVTDDSTNIDIMSASSRRTSERISEYKYGRSGWRFNQYWNGEGLNSANIPSIQYWNPGIIGVTDDSTNIDIVGASNRRTSKRILECKYHRSGWRFNQYWNGDCLKSANIHRIQYWNPGIIGVTDDSTNIDIVSASSRRTSERILECKYHRSGRQFNQYWNSECLKSANIHSIQYWNPGIIGVTDDSTNIDIVSASSRRTSERILECK